MFLSILSCNYADACYASTSTHFLWSSKSLFHFSSGNLLLIVSLSNEFHSKTFHPLFLRSFLLISSHPLLDLVTVLFVARFQSRMGILLVSFLPVVVTSCNSLRLNIFHTLYNNSPTSRAMHLCNCYCIYIECLSSPDLLLA